MSELSYNELRKGNLLYFPFISGNVEVIGVNALYGVNEPYFNKLSVIEGINMYYEPIEVFKPILLTEEWLLKLGFWTISAVVDDGMRYVAGFELWKCNDLWLCNKNGVVIKSVHQLQNLYFALTGKELTHQKIN
jgi:hypothetical protein